MIEVIIMVFISTFWSTYRFE